MLARLFRQTVTRLVTSNTKFRVRTISAYLANARTTRIKIKIEPSFNQRVRAALACPKMAIIAEVYNLIQRIELIQMFDSHFAKNPIMNQTDCKGGELK